MGNAALDLYSTPTYHPQFDDAPAKLQALLSGECEIAAEEFVAWIAERDELYDLIIGRLGERDVKQLAKKWAEEAA